MTTERIRDPMLPTVSPEHPDAPFVERWKRRNDLLCPLRLDEIDFARDEDFDAYCEPIDEVEKWIIDTRAETIVGLSVKLRLLWEYESLDRCKTPWAPLEDPGLEDGLDRRCLYAATSEAVRMAGGQAEQTMAGAPDPVLALLAEWHRLESEHKKYCDSAFGTPEQQKAEAISAQMGGVEVKMLVTEPTTPEGLALAWQFLEIDINDEPHRQCLKNLRRAVQRLGVSCLDSVRDGLKSLKEVRRDQARQ